MVGIILCFTLPLTLQAQTPDSAFVLDELIQKVRTQNPQLQSSYEDWQASKMRIPQEGSLPDPTLGLNLMNLPVNSFAFDQEPMTGKQISLMQPFPFPGKLGLKSKIAESTSQITQLQYQELQSQLIKKAKRDYYDLFYVDRALATVAANQELLREFVKIAETRYSVGDGLQQDVMRAQVELSKMIDRELKLRQKREALQAKINALTNEAADTPLGQPILPETSQKIAKLDSLVARAERSSPQLAAWDMVVTRSGRQLDLALRDRYPDFSVGVAYTQRDALDNGMKGNDFVSAMFNIKIPLYHGKKQSRNVQQKRINRSSMEHRYRNAKNSVARQLQQSLTNARKNQRLVDLYETGIIPQAEQSLESSLAGYQNDKTDFLSLLDSEMSLFQFRLDYHRFVADYHKAVAEIEAFTGTQL